MAEDGLNELSKTFSKYMTGYCLSKAILEDYSKVVAKIEGGTEQEVRERIEKRAREIWDENKPEKPV